MKTAVLALFLLFTISTTLPSASADCCVPDTDGEFLVKLRPYYIMDPYWPKLGMVATQFWWSNLPPMTVPTYRQDYQLVISQPVYPVMLNLLGATPSYWQIMDEPIKIGVKNSIPNPVVGQILQCPKSEDTYQKLQASLDDCQQKLDKESKVKAPTEPSS